MKYKTCISIAEKSPVKLKKSLIESLKRSEYVEIRLDYLDSNKIPEVMEMMQKYLKKIICTLRPKIEGGRFEGSEQERISILKMIAEFNPFLLDVEFNTIKKRPELQKYLKSTSTNLLISWHDFKKTPKISELKNKMKNMSKFSNTIKIVTTAKTLDESTRLLQLYAKKGKIDLIAFSMGEPGRISRILCLYLGSPYTYVSLGKPVAPGQFNVCEIKNITCLKFK